MNDLGKALTHGVLYMFSFLDFTKSSHLGLLLVLFTKNEKCFMVFNVLPVWVETILKYKNRMDLLITLANKEKNARATITYFVCTNSTVYVNGLRFSWN